MLATILLALLAAGPARPRAVVCREVVEARGKSRAQVAEAIEELAARFARADYVLAALLPGEPPIACFRGTAESSRPPE